ncbi:Epimerase domain-containing protein [Psidium guajava]|nr:Epimerase domain-containing protein [Psidium guajava]
MCRWPSLFGPSVVSHEHLQKQRERERRRRVSGPRTTAATISFLSRRAVEVAGWTVGPIVGFAS